MVTLSREQLEIKAALLQERLRRRAGETLLGYTIYTFDGVYQTNWHLELVSNEIDLWLAAKIPYNLLVTMPPQNGKSELCSRRLPGYAFGKNPNLNFILGAYNSDWAEDLSRDAQNVMMQESHLEVFPHARLATKVLRKGKTEVKKANQFSIVGHRGKFRASGVGGSTTGRPADIIVIDDPYKDRPDAESETKRKNVLNWYKSTLRTRMSAQGRILMLLTRWHEDDLAGWCINHMKENPDASKWKVVSLPAIFEKTEFTHPDDPRKEGELLWPEKYPWRFINAIKADQGSYDFSALYQQRPQPAGGTVIKREWFTNFIDQAPVGLSFIRYYDLAVGEKKKNDHTASIQMAIDGDENVFIRGGFRGKWSWPKAKKIIAATGKREGVEVGIEDFGTQKGFVQDLQADKELRGIAIRGCAQAADKLTRALPWIAKLEAGKFYIVGGGGWIDEFIDECVRFIGKDSKEDDQVDAVSGAYYMLSGGGRGGITSLGNIS